MYSAFVTTGALLIAAIALPVRAAQQSQASKVKSQPQANAGNSQPHATAGGSSQVAQPTVNCPDRENLIDMPPFEIAAKERFRDVQAQSNACVKAGDPGCASRAVTLQDLRKAAQAAQDQADKCIRLSNANKAETSEWYATNASMWRRLLTDMQSKQTEINAGTYTIPTSFLAAYSGLTTDIVVARFAKEDAPLQPKYYSFFDDSRETFSTLIGGVEQVGLSSRPSETEGFLRFYVQSSKLKSLDLWGAVRLLGSPNQNDTPGIAAAITNTDGTLTAQSLSSVGSAIDFSVGVSFLTRSSKGSSRSIILGTGSTTPLVGDKVTQAFLTPGHSTAECGILIARLAGTPSIARALSQYKISASPDGVATGSTNACLVNQNAPATTNGTTTYAPVTTVAFSSLNRSNFLFKDFIGFRLNKQDGDCTEESNCFLGTVDFTVGHDAAITGGKYVFNRWVYKADAVYPFPLSGGRLFLFGSFAMRFRRNSSDDAPLVLQPTPLANVTGTGATAVPNVNTAVLPLIQPDRDFYRIGVGVDISRLLSKAKAKSTDQ